MARMPTPNDHHPCDVTLEGSMLYPCSPHMPRHTSKVGRLFLYLADQSKRMSSCTRDGSKVYCSMHALLLEPHAGGALDTSHAKASVLRPGRSHTLDFYNLHAEPPGGRCIEGLPKCLEGRCRPTLCHSRPSCCKAKTRQVFHILLGSGGQKVLALRGLPP